MNETIKTLKEETLNRYNKLIDKFLEDNTAINCHNGRSEKVTGLVFFNNVKDEDDERQIPPCGYFDTVAFSLNPVVRARKGDVSVLAIVTSSAAGILERVGNVQEDIKEYNNSLSPVYGNNHKISHILMADGTVYKA